MYKKIDSFKENLESLKKISEIDAKKRLQEIRIKLYNSMKVRLEKEKLKRTHLKEYSLFLSSFQDSDIEIPGQYTGFKKPLPRYHAKIMKIDRDVKIMYSKFHPIRINFLGNDAKNYNFLLKFGEDLRLDQRLQQVFDLSNKTLEQDIPCKERYLSINTYSVIPLSISFGLIQWIHNTKSLKQFIEFSLPNKRVIDETCLEYKKWITKFGNSHDCFKKALKKYSSNDVILKMNEYISCVSTDCLKQTFITISPSLESFISLRRNFISTYATMCMIHWITGVGDRHLENILIEISNGRCLGIDFGLSFGAGIDQVVPELVPFRLTPQILGLLKPFTEYDSLGMIMTMVLKALKNEQGPLIACLDVFIHEPLNWVKDVNKQLMENKDEDDKFPGKIFFKILQK